MNNLRIEEFTIKMFEYGNSSISNNHTSNYIPCDEPECILIGVLVFTLSVSCICLCYLCCRIK